jgi:hypothetical protein
MNIMNHNSEVRVIGVLPIKYKEVVHYNSMMLARSYSKFLQRDRKLLRTWQYHKRFCMSVLFPGTKTVFVGRYRGARLRMLTHAPRDSQYKMRI